MTANIALYNMFDSAQTSSTPVYLPKSGTTYVYSYDSDDKKDDWRADGYRWRQSGNFTVKCGAEKMKKIYFLVCFLT